MSKLNLTKVALIVAGVFAGTSAWAAVSTQPSNTPSKFLDNNSTGTGYSAVGFGYNSTVAYTGIVIGSDAVSGVVSNPDATTGQGATSTRNTIAIGNGSKSLASNSIAFGNGAITNADNSVAIGRGSVTTEADTVSFGSGSLQRRLVNVAAGTADTDAVNFGQLKSLTNSTVFGSNTSTEITPAGTDSSGGTIPAVHAQNAAILGNNAKVLADGAVAIGVDSIAQTRVVETTDPTSGSVTRTVPNGYLMPSSGVTDPSVWQGDVSHGVVSFGGSYDDGQGNTVNFNRQITGVAAGSEDNDAVNVAQLKEVNNQVQGLVSGQTKVSQIDLLADPGDPANGVPATGIGLRFEAASTSGGSGAANGIGRLAYTDTNGDLRQVATMSDGFMVSGGNTGTTASDGSTVAPVKVDLNQGISFLGDEYLQTTVTAGDNGGAKVTIGASQALKDFLANSGVQPSDPNTPSDPGNSGNTGGTWTPNAAQQAALNGNFANGITVAAGEGNQAIQIKQGNVDMGGNRIQNVGSPINDGDAANKAYVDSTSRSLRNKINDVDKDLRAGVAMAMAVGNLPQAYMPGKSIVGLSAGTYHGQGGFALGLSHATENRQWILKGAASVDTRGNFGGTLSAGYQF